MRWWGRPALAGLLAGVGVAAGAQGPALLARLSIGEWELRDAATGDVRRLCVRDPIQLLQPRAAAGEACTRTVLDNGARAATVSYSCPGGAGRTTLTLANAGEARIETQGLVAGEPFDAAYDARRVGRCG